MQEKAYDSKSDIWTLGCLIYELWVLEPSFHEAKPQSELSIVFGMVGFTSLHPVLVVYLSDSDDLIPPLPRGYSQALTSVIESPLNPNVSFPNFLQILVTNSASSLLCAAQLLQ